jgi:SRSO17 transposase
VRLYLPSTWLRESDETTLKTVPEEYRQPASKREIALSLIDDLLQEGEPTKPVLAEGAFHAHGDWLETLSAKGLHAVEGTDERLARSLEGLDSLNRTFGLDHFEGRTWHGWHHHAVLVFTAYYFVAQMRREMV